MAGLLKAIDWRRSVLERRTARHIVYGLLGLIAVVCYGIIGLLVMGWSLSDAFYMVMISVTTVGFGEVRPLESLAGRLHIIAVIAMGSVAAAYTIGNLVAFITEGEIQSYLGHQRVLRQIDELSDHVIVVGYGRMGRMLCQELQAAGVPYLLIDRAADVSPELESRGILHLLGNATDEEILRKAGLERARAIVTCIPSDAENVFITLTARDMAPEVLIVARAEQPSTSKKLHQAGANHVVLPAAIGASRIASLLTNPSAVEFAELVTQRSRLAIQMDELAVQAQSGLLGQTLRNLDIGRKTGVMVIAIKRTDGSVEFPATGDEPLKEGDTIVMLGRRENLEQLRQTYLGR